MIVDLRLLIRLTVVLGLGLSEAQSAEPENANLRFFLVADKLSDETDSFEFKNVQTSKIEEGFFIPTPVFDEGALRELDLTVREIGARPVICLAFSIQDSGAAILQGLRGRELLIIVGKHPAATISVDRWLQIAKRKERLLVVWPAELPNDRIYLEEFVKELRGKTHDGK